MVESSSAINQFNNLINVLDTLMDTHLIFTKSNADTDGRIIFKMIEDFVNNHPYAKSFTSLGSIFPDLCKGIITFLYTKS